MMKFEASALLLLLLFSLTSALAANATNTTLGDSKDYGELVTNPCEDLRLAGFICVDCATLGFCTHVNGQWQTVLMTNCDEERGFYCSEEDSIGCTWQPRCQVPVRGKFYCQLPGIYPDPYDCRSYHVCNERNEDSPVQCTNGAAYSLLTQSCTLSKESEQCTTKQYNCSYVGETHAWSSNSSYYYVCQKELQNGEDFYYPLMMQCQAGYIFNEHSCVRQTAAQRMSSFELPQPTTSCRTGTLKPGDTADSYYFCLNGEFEYATCASGAYFDANRLVCVPGTPSNSGSSSEPDAPASSPAASTCTRSGQTVDLTDCRSYYYCQAGEELKHATCPTGYYYDTDSCLPGSC